MSTVLSSPTVQIHSTKAIDIRDDSLFGLNITRPILKIDTSVGTLIKAKDSEVVNHSKWSSPGQPLINVHAAQSPIFLRIGGDASILSGSSSATSPYSDLLTHSAISLSPSDIASSLEPVSPARKKSRKGDGHIPRPRNSFICFREKFTQEHRQLNLPQPTLSKVAAQEWRAMSDEARLPYIRMAEEEKERHSQRFPDYIYSPSPPKKGRNINNKCSKETKKGRQNESSKSSPISVTLGSVASRNSKRSSVDVGSVDRNEDFQRQILTYRLPPRPESSILFASALPQQMQPIIEKNDIPSAIPVPNLASSDHDSRAFFEGYPVAYDAGIQPSISEGPLDPLSLELSSSFAFNYATEADGQPCSPAAPANYSSAHVSPFSEYAQWVASEFQQSPANFAPCAAMNYSLGLSDLYVQQEAYLQHECIIPDYSLGAPCLDPVHLSVKSVDFFADSNAVAFIDPHQYLREQDDLNSLFLGGSSSLHGDDPFIPF